MNRFLTRMGYMSHTGGTIRCRLPPVGHDMPSFVAVRGRRVMLQGGGDGHLITALDDLNAPAEVSTSASLSFRASEPDLWLGVTDLGPSVCGSSGLPLYDVTYAGVRVTCHGASPQSDSQKGGVG